MIERLRIPVSECTSPHCPLQNPEDEPPASVLWRAVKVFGVYNESGALHPLLRCLHDAAQKLHQKGVSGLPVDPV